MFFAMMYSQNGTTAMPIVTGEDGEEVMFWETEEAVHKHLKDHTFAQALGYEIFEIPLAKVYK